MSKKFGLFAHGAAGSYELKQEFADLVAARKSVRTGDLAIGVYSILEFCNEGISVEPPPQATKPVVNMGTAPREGTRPRKPKPAAEGETSTTARGSSPRRRGGLSGGGASASEGA